MEIERLKGKCGVCLQPLTGDVLTLCNICQTYYHPECWEFNKRKCAVYGCWKSPFPKRPIGPPQQHADIFNPYMLAAMVTAVVALLVWSFYNWFSR
jgi:hypothetical protein